MRLPLLLEPDPIPNLLKSSNPFGPLVRVLIVVFILASLVSAKMKLSTLILSTITLASPARASLAAGKYQVSVDGCASSNDLAGLSPCAFNKKKRNPN